MILTVDYVFNSCVYGKLRSGYLGNTVYVCMYGTALWNTYTVNCMKKNREVATTDV